MSKLFRKILIANRGEIACRIIKTAKKLRIKTVAIYSTADIDAPHVLNADEAYCVGPPQSSDSYLNSKKILEIAIRSGAEAIHPGYGFLSENANFAEECRKAKIYFIGPPISAIKAMASKSAAKQIICQAGIALIPGYHGDRQDEAYLLKQADQIGFPIMIKASAGGGGKGMRVVSSALEFKEALASAKREAKSSFKDEEVIIEKYIKDPRHIEVQIFSDSHGNCVHMYERDCSIQRRHQKIIEESPAINLCDSVKKNMRDAAVKAATSINYVGAGTIEFLVDIEQNYYFMEMNTRLQVEHPVTEMLTGIDLVEWQIRIAAGQELPLVQSQIESRGHAIEVRLYAEDPDSEFMPSTGKIYYISPIMKDDNKVRLDSGVVVNSKVLPFYDPLLAKLILWGQTRYEALSNLKLALSNFYIVGCNNNINFLRKIIESENFKKGLINTNFINTIKENLTITLSVSIELMAVCACSYKILGQLGEVEKRTGHYSPWTINDNWQLNITNQQQINFMNKNELFTCFVKIFNDHIEIKINNITYSCISKIQDNQLQIQVDDRRLSLTVIEVNKSIYLLHEGQVLQFDYDDPMLHYQTKEEISSVMNAPMPGTVIAIHTRKGAMVSRGEKILVMEAMKMEHTIQAPADGIINEIYYKVGDVVNEGATLVAFNMETRGN